MRNAMNVGLTAAPNCSAKLGSSAVTSISTERRVKKTQRPWMFQAAIKHNGLAMISAKRLSLPHSQMRKYRNAPNRTHQSHTKAVCRVSRHEDVSFEW
uniref:Uncharacterized protein n=1 Tax=Hyaloperonospora arabidopsidis (strain Emoy2) TaxID=559515 RepID=M4BXD6_HYAAE